MIWCIAGLNSCGPVSMHVTLNIPVIILVTCYTEIPVFSLVTCYTDIPVIVSCYLVLVDSGYLLTLIARYMFHRTYTLW